MKVKYKKKAQRPSGFEPMTSVDCTSLTTVLQPLSKSFYTLRILLKRKPTSLFLSSLSFQKLGQSDACEVSRGPTSCSAAVERMHYDEVVKGSNSFGYRALFSSLSFLIGLSGHTFRIVVPP